MASAARIATSLRLATRPVPVSSVSPSFALTQRYVAWMTESQVTSPSATQLAAQARGRADQVRSYFHPVGETQIPDTKTTYRVRWLALDANNRPRLNALALHLYQRITDYCIPRSRIDEAKRQDEIDGGNAQIMALQEEARRLFLDSETSGEGGELLLFFLLEAELGLPQVLCKMPLKTNRKMPIHGVDGVHAGIQPNGNLAIYWGESKLYGSFQSALTDCFNSITPFLLDDGTGTAHKDLVLARDNLDVGDRQLTLQLVKYLTDDNPKRLSLEVSGACLVGFTHDHYGPPFQADGATLLAEVDDQIRRWSTSVKTRVTNRKIEDFTIEFFCLPLPSVADLRAEFQRLIGHGR